jgi:hypothetical protein
MDRTRFIYVYYVVVVVVRGASSISLYINKVFVEM